MKYSSMGILGQFIVPFATIISKISKSLKLLFIKSPVKFRPHPGEHAT